MMSSGEAVGTCLVIFFIMIVAGTDLSESEASEGYGGDGDGQEECHVELIVEVGVRFVVMWRQST